MAPLHRPRYDALADHGVIECTIAVGFDERAASDARDHGGARTRVEALVRQFQARGYVEGRNAAAPLLARRSRATDSACATFLSRSHAAAFAGDTRSAVVVRIVANTDGAHGPDAVRAFVDGLAHSSICAYAGHARHGLGPDFDATTAGMSMRDRSGGSIDADSLRRLARAEALSRGVRIESVLDEWVASGRLVMAPRADSRVIVDGRLERHGSRARLTRWLARVDGAHRSAVVFGPNGLLARTSNAPPHRLWFLLACRSTAWFPVIRRTPGLDASAVALVGSSDQAGPADLNRFPWALDAILSGESWPHVLGALEDAPAARIARFVVDHGDASDAAGRPWARA